MRHHTLEFKGGQLRFSAGHFTIFSENERECLHGHNYTIEASMTAASAEPGITFDYSLFREKLVALCHQLRRRFLLPTQSPYLNIKEEGDYYIASFDSKKIPFLKEDVILMSIANTTLEELSHWFVERVLEEKQFIDDHKITAFDIKVYNGPEHCAKAGWSQ